MAIDPNFLPLVQYTTAERRSDQVKDPINLVFVGELSEPATVSYIVQNELGLRHDKGLSDQFFSEPALVAVAHRQDLNQSNHFISGWWSRIHSRVYAVFTPHPTYGRLTVAPIHIDHWVSCPPIVNDAAESYDRARKWATSCLRDSYDVAVIPLRSFDPILQCDGSRTPTDGRCALIAEPGTLASLGLDPLRQDEQ